MAFKLIEWINGITRLNKTTMDTFQNNIKDAFDNFDGGVKSLAKYVLKGIAEVPDLLNLQIPFSEAAFQTGEAFTLLEDGSIKANKTMYIQIAGIYKVSLLSASSGAFRKISILVNDQEIFATQRYHKGNDYNTANGDFISTILSVNENDIIKVVYQGTYVGTSGELVLPNDTYITIEEK